MPLQKVNVPISFAQGIDTGTDDKQLVGGALTILENGVFKTIRQISKRFGLLSLATADLSDVTVSDSKSITAFQSELIQYTDKKLYTYSSSLNKWVDKGRAFNIIPSSSPVIRNAYEQKSPAVGCVANIELYVWEDSRGGIRGTILDSDTSLEFRSDFAITGTGSVPKIVTFNNIFYILYLDSGTLRFRSISSSSPTQMATEVVILADLDGAKPAYDYSVQASQLAIAYHSSGGSKFRIKTFDINLSNTATLDLGEVPSEAISITSDSANNLIVAYATTTAVKALAYNLNLTSQLLAPTTIEAIAGVVQIAVSNKSEDDFEVVYEITDATPSKHFIKKNTFDLTPVVGSPSVLVRSIGIASNMFKVNGVNYFSAVHESDLQSTYFILDFDGNIVVKLSYAIAGKLIEQFKLNHVCPVSSEKIILASQIKGRFVSQDDVIFSLLGINSSLIDFNPESQYQDAEKGSNLHISGGILQMYDAKDLVEHSFHIFPEDLSAGTNSASGGSMSDGTYQYVAVYAWTDNRGQVHRSAPSIALDVVTSAGGSAQTQEVIVPTLRLTNKSNVIIELYRTEDTGSIFYKLTTFASPVFNSKTVDTITYVDGASDASLLDNELLYTTGAVLENIAAPSSKFIKSFGDRLVLAGLENENLIQYSKIRSENEPVEFSDLLTISVEPDGGPITAIGVMDDKLVIFKKSLIYFISGEGPTNAGVQDSFTKPERISSDVGCISANSVVLTPMGLMFQSNKGIYLLTRSLQAVYIGKNIEKFNNVSITSGTLVPDTNQVRFTTSDNVTLVFDYLVNQWATFTNYEALDSTVLDNTYYILTPSNVVKKENRDNYTDDGSAIKLDLEVGWLSFANLQGFQRVYNMLVLGDIRSQHKLRVRVAYNYLNSFEQEVTIDSDNFTDFTPYGGASPYGEPTGKGYGGVANRYQFDVNFKKQKCESIKVRFTEIQDVNIGEGLALSALTFKVGVKSSTFKTAQKRDFGTT